MFDLHILAVVLFFFFLFFPELIGVLNSSRNNLKIGCCCFFFLCLFEIRSIGRPSPRNSLLTRYHRNDTLIFLQDMLILFFFQYFFDFICCSLIKTHTTFSCTGVGSYHQQSPCSLFSCNPHRRCFWGVSRDGHQWAGGERPSCGWRERHRWGDPTSF